MAARLSSRRGRHQVTLAHRGWCSRHPENTLPSLAAAMRVADYCEIDVRVTSDDELIIMHDSTLRRTTDVASVFPTRADDPVATFTLAEMGRLDAGGWFDPAVATGVPTLRQALDLLQGSQCGALLELKTDSMVLVASALSEHLARHPGAPVAAASVDPRRSAALRRLMPELTIGVLFLDAVTITDAEIAGYAEYADFLCFRSDRIPASLVDRVHRAGLMMMHNTNTGAFMAEGARHGGDGTMTDRPDLREDVLRGTAGMTIEAESLIGVCRTSGPAPRIRGDRGLGFKLSGRAGLEVALGAGDWVELPFVADHGRASLRADLVRHPGGAMTEASLDNGAVVAAVDLGGRSPSARSVTLAHGLRPGPHRIRFTAAARTTLLLDALTLSGDPAA